MSPQQSTDIHDLFLTVIDPDLDRDMARSIVADLSLSDETEGGAVITKLIESARRGQGESLANAKLQEVQRIADELKRGALREATVAGPVATKARGLGRRIEVRTSSGDVLFPLVIDDDLFHALRPGDGVLGDSQMRTVLSRNETRTTGGEIGRFERVQPNDMVLVTVHEIEHLLLPSEWLREQIAAGLVRSGQQLDVCTRRRIAFDTLLEEGGVSYYRYLSRDPLPDVQLEQLGDPPGYIADVLAHAERELTQPELGRKYHLPRAKTVLLAGISGTGKTVSIEATIRSLAEQMAQQLGVPVEQLPPRVMRLRSADVLSKYFGESDQRIDRFFDEVLKLSEEKFTTPDGREHELITTVVIEEADAFGRERGTTNEQVYDRIQTTLLERLDANSRRFGQRLIVVLATTNVPHLLDPAFLRRCAGTVVHFGRLRRKGFTAVLRKQLAGKPVAATYGSSQAQRERRLLRDVVEWMYSDEHDRGQVELTYVGSAQPVVFRRREFVTAGLLDRAMHEAAAAACETERQGGPEGITREVLCAALDRQIRSVVEQLSSQNAHNYLTLPDGVRVGNVRRLDQPTVGLLELERVSA